MPKLHIWKLFSILPVKKGFYLFIFYLMWDVQGEMEVCYLPASSCFSAKVRWFKSNHTKYD